MIGLADFQKVRYDLTGDTCADTYTLDKTVAAPRLPERIWIPPAEYLAVGAHEIYEVSETIEPSTAMFRPNGYGIPYNENAGIIICDFGESYPLTVLAWDHLLDPKPKGSNPYALTGYALSEANKGVNTAGLVLLAVERIKSDFR